MKKNIILLAAAALTLGMTACTDDFNYDDIIDNGEVIEVPTIKSTADLVGTEWTYTPEDIAYVDFDGDTIALIPMSDLQFSLAFDAAAAHLTFPEDITVLTVTDEYTLDEIAAMDFAYEYDLATTSGTLTYGDFEIGFTYDEANDAITVTLPVAFEGYEEEATGLQLVFTR